MATINKKLIHFKSLSDFEARLAAGDVLSTSIVWIKDAKKIWTHGEYYDCNGGGDNVYIFNPEGVAAEEYAGLQDAVNNGKQVVMWAEDGGTSPVVCTVIYGYYTENAYYVMFSYTFAGDNEGTIFYNSVNVSETSIDVVGNIASPVITGVDDAMNINSTNPVQNKVIYEALGVVSEQANSKQEQLVSGTNIKTINGESILGSGDITIGGGETLTEADILAMGFTKNAGTITGVSINGTTIPNNGNIFLPNASTSAYGVTKLSSATNSTSTSLAATPSAVKAAYDLAKGKVSESDIFDNKTDGIIKAEALYNDKSQGGLIYALPTSRLALEDDCDDVLVARSEIFAGSPEQSMLQADAFYETTTGTIYGLPTSSIVTNGGEDEIIATQSYVDNAVTNAGGAYNLTSLTKAQLDSFASGSTITINANDVSAIRANKIITITSNSGRCLMAAWSAQSSSVVQLTFLCDNVVYIAKASLQSNGTAKINAVAKHLVGANSGGGGGYVPMPETFIWQDETLEHTLSPNTSLYAFLVGDGRVYIDLQEPTSFDVVNEYTMIFRTFGYGNAITIDKTIIWANDNHPVLYDSVAEIIEISVKCVNAANYDGIQYLGTWVKYSV